MEPAQSLQIEEATRGNQTAALQLLWSHLTVEIREQYLAQTLKEAPAGLVPGLWVGLRQGQIVAVALVQLQPGRTAVAMPPRAVESEPPQTALETLCRALEDARRRDVAIVQALLESDTGRDAELFESAGLQHISNLLYLVSLRTAFPNVCPQDGLVFSSLVEFDETRLAAVVRRTYVGSLDCPRIDGARALDDVLAGYRATGAFSPERWLIAARQGVDVGCVLLTDHPRHNQWELLYMGVVPEARGNAWGVAITRHAQWLAWRAGRERLVLAVDAANEPAIRMYAAAGFVAWDHRSVFVRMD